MFTTLKKIFLALNRTEQAIFLVAALGSLISFALLAATIVNTSTKVVPGYGGSFTEGFLHQPSFINPVIAKTDIDKALVRLIFSNIGDVASKIEAENGGRAWKVRLKENLFWHDGQKLTSDDIAFTIQKIQDPDSLSPLHENWQGVAVQRLSELELQFNVGTPYAFFEGYLKNLYILPRHLFLDIPVANWRISNFNLKPIGSGPYRFESYEIKSDGFITDYHLKANTKYFSERPFIDRLNIKLFSKKEDLIQAFNLGRIDGLPGVDPEDLDGIKRPYASSSFALPNYYALFLNQSQNIALKEASVREALTLAIDKNEIIQKVFSGQAEVAYGPLPSISPYFNPKLQNASTSIVLANQLLDDEGWILNTSGIREKKIKSATVELAVSITVPDVFFLKETARLIQTQWTKLGVQTTLRELPLDQITDPVIKNREYQVLLFGNILNLGFEPYAFWHSSERFYPGLNLSLYSNKEADRLIETIRQNFDFETRQKEFYEFQDVIASDYPAIFLYSPHYLLITDKDLKGVPGQLINEPADHLRTTPFWYLKTRRILK